MIKLKIYRYLNRDLSTVNKANIELYILHLNFIRKKKLKEEKEKNMKLV